jgi:hypothetical protein
MRPKKIKQPKKYITGGAIAALGGTALQAGIGLYQMNQAKKAAAAIKETPTARPAEYAEMLKQARNAELEQRRMEELNRTISTGISAAQQGGGRALVGALPGMVQAADAGALNILEKRQDQTMQALQFGAQGAEAEMGREFQREMMERGAAQAALEGGLQNIAGGLGQLGSAATYGVFGGGNKQKLDKDGNPIAEDGAMITGGKFDHKTNPIDIVQKGKKIGEMTGGEVILNPSQQKKLSKESAYFRQLLKKFNKQK